MKKWLIPIIIVGVIAFAGYSWVQGFYNTTIKLNENVKTAFKLLKERDPNIEGYVFKSNQNTILVS